jgi:predicted nucleic acid-binding protein
VIPYLDTSWLVKIFVEEDESEEARAMAAEAVTTATSAVAYVEARAAFARKHREGSLSDDEHRELVATFEAHWPGYASIDVSREIISAAADLVDRYPLRGFDAIHLASALALRARLGDDVTFCAADRRLNAAAAAEGLRVAP